MGHKLSEVQVDPAQLLRKNYGALELVGKPFTINAITLVNGDMGEYMVCDITGDGLDAGRKFSTGAHNIVAKVKDAVAQNLLPLDVTVVQVGRAFDVQ